MSDKIWAFRVRDMLESIARILSVTNGLDYSSFAQNVIAKEVVERHLITIGEAARNIPKSVQEKYSDIPWRKIMGIRHIVVHDYDGVDYEVVWDVVENHLAGLQEQLEKIRRDIDSA